MLQENGFILKSQKGSHMKFEKDGRVVVVPNQCCPKCFFEVQKYRDYPNGTPLH